MVNENSFTCNTLYFFSVHMLYSNEKIYTKEVYSIMRKGKNVKGHNIVTFLKLKFKHFKSKICYIIGEKTVKGQLTTLYGSAKRGELGGKALPPC